jgi:hypothetical protein
MFGKRGQEMSFSWTQIALFVLLALAVITGILLSTGWGSKAIQALSGIGLTP